MTLRCYWNLPSSTNLNIFQGYVDYLNEVLNQTITDSRLVIVNQRYINSFQNQNIQPLTLKPHGFLFFHQVVSVRFGKVVVEDSGYRYSLSPDPDNEEQWVFRYEYSLTSEVHVPHAHFHLNATMGNKQIKRVHFPTERLSIEKIIAHLILEHEVIPKMDDWLQFLSESHLRFTRLRTDPPLFPWYSICVTLSALPPPSLPRATASKILAGLDSICPVDSWTTLK